MMCVFAGGPYLPLLPGFKKLFPGIHPTPLVASVLFFTPIIRDFVSWCGVRQVLFHDLKNQQMEFISSIQCWTVILQTRRLSSTICSTLVLSTVFCERLHKSAEYMQVIL